MNSRYLHPGQYSQPQTVQSTRSPNVNGQATTYANYQSHGPQASEATPTSRSFTTTTPQHHAIPSAPQYLQQPFQYLPLREPVATGVAYQQTPTVGADFLVQPQHTQNQQPMVSQVSQQLPILKPQMQPPVMPQQSLQPLPQHHSMASGMQYVYQSQQMAQQQQQMFQQPPIPQQPQQPPAIDFTQLLESSPAPPHVPANDFYQLMQAAPPVNTHSSVVTTTTTRTETYKGANAGGEARKQAEAKGEHEIQRFEEKVQNLIRRICPCPTNAPWYNSAHGYLCGEGIHYLYHKDIDRAFKQPGWLPAVTWVNTFSDPEARYSGTFQFIHPPPVAFHEPMHRVHRKFMQAVRESELFETQASEANDFRETGCNEECLRGVDVVSKAESDRHCRENGFNPYATRHALFN